MNQKIEIKEEFLQQACKLARGAEILPGGVEELAIKLQKAKETNKNKSAIFVIGY